MFMSLNVVSDTCELRKTINIIILLLDYSFVQCYTNVFHWIWLNRIKSSVQNDLEYVTENIKHRRNN